MEEKTACGLDKEEVFKHTVSLRACEEGCARHLHGGDDHPSVHHELAQRRRALVAVPAVDHQQAADVSELSDGEVCRQRRLLPLLGTTEPAPRSEVREAFRDTSCDKWKYHEAFKDTM